MAVYHRGQLTFTPENMGRLLVHDAGNPAAGSAWHSNEGGSAGPYPGYFWKMINISFKFTCDANISNRYIYLEINRGSPFDVCRIAVQTPQTAGQVRRYYCDGNFPRAELLVTDAVGTNHFLPLHHKYFSNPYRFAIGYEGWQVGDQLSEILYSVMEWRCEAP